MRRALALGVLTAIAALAAALPVSAETTAFGADVQGWFGIRASSTCPPDLDCGRARIDGFGKATRTLAITGFAPGVPEGCNSLTAVERLVLDADGSTLELALEAALCNPGASAAAPHTPRSQGDPFTATGTYVVLGGTGVFAGATGGGTLTALGAGDAIVIHYDGTLALP